MLHMDDYRSDKVVGSPDKQLTKLNCIAATLWQTNPLEYGKAVKDQLMSRVKPISIMLAHFHQINHAFSRPTHGWPLHKLCGVQ